MTKGQQKANEIAPDGFHWATNLTPWAHTLAYFQAQPQFFRVVNKAFDDDGVINGDIAVYVRDGYTWMYDPFADTIEAYVECSERAQRNIAACFAR